MTDASTGGPDAPDTITVGIDGSEASVGAARWAGAQAERTGARLVLVSAWQYPSSWGSTIPLPEGYDPEADAASLVDPVATALAAEFPAVAVSTLVVEGHPAEVLVETSRDADLLVVGSRGHGAFTGMLLGSVSQHCASHARCPVLVYRDPSSEG